ncbi:MAG: nitroreductase [Candidatus Desulfofervidaceae bacterium]|nr:nitroreductase [Candidatus Desulfofervidaceae bacterium]
MSVLASIRGRRSIRGFLAKTVDESLITQVLEAAIQAPSACNMQPWEFFVVKGEGRNKLVSSLLEAYHQEKRPPRTQSPVPERYKKRMQTLFEAIKPFAEQTPGFDTWKGSLSFYNAPVVILVAKDKAVDASRILDIGLAVQNMLLAAHDLGLGTCAIGLSLRYEDIIRETLNLPSHLELLLTVALGYPDESLAINQFKSPRVDLSECVQWIEKI